MTSESGLSRRVTRLEDDTVSLYELVTDVRSTQDVHTSRLDAIETTLTDHTGRLDTIETILHEVVRRLPEPS